MPEKTPHITCQTRTFVNEDVDLCLQEYVEYCGHLKRKIYSDINRRVYADKNEMKSTYISKYRISARQFNSISNGLEGRVKSVNECNKLILDDAKENLKKTNANIAKFKKKLKKLKAQSKISATPILAKNLFEVRRRLTGLYRKRNRLLSRVKKCTEKTTGKKPLNHDQRRKAKRTSKYKNTNKQLSLKIEEVFPKLPPISFFGKKELTALSQLSPNCPKAEREELRRALKASAKDEIFLLGSKDETGGNQSCTPIMKADGTFDLNLILPQTIAAKMVKKGLIKGDRLIISNQSISYRENDFIAALQKNEERRFMKGKVMQAEYGDSYKQLGVPITLRFTRDEKSWLTSLSFPIKPADIVTRTGYGSVGVDINNDHLAISETDMRGNLINSFSIPMHTYGCPKGQRKSIIGDCVKVLTEYALKVSKPIILEKLDFAKKKKSLKQYSKRRARMLSSFAYKAIIENIKSTSNRKGIEVISVNPAYTSLIGRIKYARRYGLSVHEAAALVIARRGSGYIERLPKTFMDNKFPNVKGGTWTLRATYTTSGKTEEMKSMLGKESESLRHSSSAWHSVQRIYQTGLAALFRAIDHRKKTLLTG